MCDRSKAAFRCWSQRPPRPFVRPSADDAAFRFESASNTSPGGNRLERTQPSRTRPRRHRARKKAATVAPWPVAGPIQQSPVGNAPTEVARVLPRRPSWTRTNPAACHAAPRPRHAITTTHQTHIRKRSVDPCSGGSKRSAPASWAIANQPSLRRLDDAPPSPPGAAARAELAGWRRVWRGGSSRRCRQRGRCGSERWVCATPVQPAH
jgi:hypothetical protein